MSQADAVDLNLRALRAEAQRTLKGGFFSIRRFEVKRFQAFHIPDV